MSRASLDWYRLRWPREVKLDRLQAMSLLLATTAGAPVVVETVGRAGSVEHRFGLRSDRSSVPEHLRVVVSGLGLMTLDSRPALSVGRAVDIRLTTPQRPLQVEEAELVSHALLTAMATCRRDEEIVLQWQLLTALPPAYVGATDSSEPMPMSVGDVLLGRRSRLDGEGRRALRAKRALPVWRAVGRIGVRAAVPAREERLLRAVVAALRTAESPGVRVIARRCPPRKLQDTARSWFAPLRLNTAELAAVSGWPVGLTSELPIERANARLLRATKAIPRASRVLGESSFPGGRRPVALAANDGLRHLHVLGPTGTGKSTLLLNLITQDIAADRGVVVMEPKGDLIGGVLERIPPGRVEDVVLLDPADAQPVGLNPLAAKGRPPELVADELLGMFRSMYESSWGPRTNDILGASLLTLARTPGMTLCALPALLYDAGFRHRVVSSLDDPIGLQPFWQTFEGWSEAERLAAIAPSMNRIRPFLLRPQLRAVLGQSQPRVDPRQVFSERKILLVNLSRGALGGESAALLGSLILNQLWAAALRRTEIPADRRHPVFVYVDEVQDYLRLPTDLGEALVQARGLGVGFILAHQHLSQLDPSTRSAVLTNARSRICFQLPTEDARTLATSPLEPEDFRELPAFEAYAQLVAAGAVQRWCSIRTASPSEPISDAEAIRRHSRNRYGFARSDVDAEIARLLEAGDAASDLAPRRRSDRGAA